MSMRVLAMAGAVLVFGSTTTLLAEEPAPALYACPDGVSLRADFSGDQVTVTLSGSLTAEPAASGMRYEGALGLLQGKGDQLDWSSAAELADCVLVPGGAALAGRRWELVQFQSLDAATGTQVLEDPGRHTLQFDAHGAVFVRFDCNVGRGGWEAKPSGSSGGSLMIDRVATTLALCQDDPFPRLAEHLGDIRGYRLSDGQLHLSLVADGGILSFRPGL
ncbi:MAG: META domain-containing protein [Pseudomonadota bacterium]